jgi:hypothetical protein
MHRGGTSAVTRGLSALGISLGTDFLPAAADNETGFWEDKDLNAFNEELLAAIDEHWSSVRLYEGHFHELPELPALQTRAGDLLATKLETHASFAFKDPRSSRLLTFWTRVFESLDLAPRYVIVTRCPLSVAQSLLKRNGLRETQSYLLWLEHMLAALRLTEDCPRVVVDYDRLLSNPAEQLLRIRTALNLPDPPNSTQLQAEYANEFLREDLRHTRYDEESLRQAADVPPSVIRLHQLLTTLARDELSPSDPTCKRQIRQIWRSMNEFSTAFSLAEVALREEISLNGTLRNKNQELHEHEGALTNLNTTLQEQRRHAESLEARVALEEERRARLELALADADENFRAITTNLTTLLQEQRQQSERLEVRLATSEERRARLDLALVEAHEEIRGIAIDLAARSGELARFETSLRRSDARAHELAAELLMHDRKLQWLTIEATASTQRAQQLSWKLEAQERETRALERVLEIQLARSSRLEHQLSNEHERSRTLAKANDELARVAEYERTRGTHAEQSCELSRATADLATERLEALSKSASELAARHRETLNRLERIESGSFWRYTWHVRLLWEYVERRLLGRNRAFRMIPNKQLEMLPHDHAWRSIGDDPNFELVSPDGHLPRGWVIVATTLKSSASVRIAKLYADYGDGFSEDCAVRLRPARDGSVRQIVHLGRSLKALRWDPVDGPGELIQGLITMSEISAVGRLIRMLWRVLHVLRNYPDDMLRGRNLTVRCMLTDLSRAYVDASELLAASPLHTSVH